MPGGTITSTAYVNLPPDVIGKNGIFTPNRTTLIYTMSMFTTGTTPPYNDPEGDLIDAIRIVDISNGLEINDD